MKIILRQSKFAVAGITLLSLLVSGSGVRASLNSQPELRDEYELKVAHLGESLREIFLNKLSENQQFHFFHLMDNCISSPENFQRATLSLDAVNERANELFPEDIEDEASYLGTCWDAFVNTFTPAHIHELADRMTSEMTTGEREATFDQFCCELFPPRD